MTKTLKQSGQIKDVTQEDVAYFLFSELGNKTKFSDDGRYIKRAVTPGNPNTTISHEVGKNMFVLGKDIDRPSMRAPLPFLVETINLDAGLKEVVLQPGISQARKTKALEILRRMRWESGTYISIGFDFDNGGCVFSRALGIHVPIGDTQIRFVRNVPGHEAEWPSAEAFLYYVWLGKELP